ncbi:uncharacterized protein LOC134178830 [Corticium candelabrum]|uniref:uncharacterized protein LOC134178830 n=1 Tax=Corticium candelabrum TaxID=121492 RepID=UPI002E25B184|nr:uncharacterized protein LOC134178830 [Corticium candelabrum]
MNYRSLRSSGEFSDLVVQVRGKDFHLHRFPLLAHCEYFRGLQRSGMSDDSFVKLDLLPGGSNTMSLVADFCYGIPIGDKITTGNIGHVTCASSYLQMSEPGSLGSVCKDKLEMLTRDANNSIEILVSCWDVVVAAEAENVTSLCIQGAVQYWNREFAKMGKSWFPLERAQKWFAGLKKLPVKWVIKIMDSMQAKGCSPLLRTYFAARFLDCIMQHYSCLSKPTLDLMTFDSGSGSISTLYVFSAVGMTLPSKCNTVSTHEATDLQLASTTQGQESSSSAAATAVDDTTFGLISYLNPISSDTQEADLKNFFERFLAKIADDALSLVIPTVTVSWFASVLHFSSQFICSAVERLAAICAESYIRLTLEDVKMYKPSVMSKLNNLAKKNKYHCCNAVRSLVDQYLCYQSEQGLMNSSQFAQVLNSSVWSSRTSFEVPFQAFEKLLERDLKANPHNCKWVMIQDHSVHMSAIQEIDFTMVSQEALERASKNVHIPDHVVMNAAVKLCSRLRDELQQTKGHLSQAQLQFIQQKRESSNRISRLENELKRKDTVILKQQDAIISYKSEPMHLKDLKNEAQIKQNRLMALSYEQLQGSWMVAGPLSLRYHGYGFQQCSHSDQTLTIRVSAVGNERDAAKTLDMTVEFESRSLSNSRKVGKRGELPPTAKTEIGVRPAYILSLNDEGDDVVQYWNAWYDKTKLGHRVSRSKPPFVIYDQFTDSLLVPSLNPAEQRLVQWKRRH